MLLRAAEVAPKCLLGSLVKRKEDRFKAAFMWPKHGNEGDRSEVEGEEKKKGGVGSGFAVTCSIRHNAHVTGICTLRLGVLTDKPSYSKIPCSIACNVPRYFDGKVVTT